jgi:hypothetical protein
MQGVRTKSINIKLMIKFFWRHGSMIFFAAGQGSAALIFFQTGCSLPDDGSVKFL